MSKGQLKNKVLVVIGGTTGIGLSAAAAFIAAGARVVVVGRDRVNVRAAGKQLGRAALALAGDARSPETSWNAINAAIARFGGFHGLYHVAGGSGRQKGDGPLDQVTDEGWVFTLDLNVTSLFYSNRAATQQFLRQKTPGAVLNMSSVLGFSPAAKHFGTHAYAAAKAAALGLTKAAAAYYAPHSIRFNALAPALVDTPMAKRAAGDAAIQRFISTKQPLDGGRIGRASDLDAAAVYLLSDDAVFVTGQILAIDGGWSVSDGQHSPTASSRRAATRSPRPTTKE